MQFVAPPLELCQLEIVYRCRSSMTLPRWKGSLLRGGFGRALRRMFCQQQCADPEICATPCTYRSVFHPPIRHQNPEFRTLKEAPRPYMLRPPLDDRTSYHDGDLLTFGMLLVGESLNHLMPILSAWTILGELGLGLDHGRVMLDQVYHVHPRTGERTPMQLLQLASDPSIRRNLSDLFAIQPQLGSNLRLAFVTPLHLKYQRQPVRIPEAHIIVRNIIRRLSMLSAWYGEAAWEAPVSDLIAAAEQIQIRSIDTKWVDWSRTSSEQHTMNLGGLVGNVTYEHVPPAIQSILWLGSLIHIGKGCVFGNGWYRLQAI